MFIKLHEVKLDQNCVQSIEEVFCFVKYRLVLFSHNCTIMWKLCAYPRHYSYVFRFKTKVRLDAYQYTRLVRKLVYKQLSLCH